MSKSKTTAAQVTEWFLAKGYAVICSECKEYLRPGDKVHWDHIHAEALDGPHDPANLRPTHAACNLKKGGRETKALAKIDRLTGKTKGRPKRKWATRKMRSRHRPWSHRPGRPQL